MFGSAAPASGRGFFTGVSTFGFFFFTAASTGTLASGGGGGASTTTPASSGGASGTIIGAASIGRMIDGAGVP